MLKTGNFLKKGGTVLLLTILIYYTISCIIGCKLLYMFVSGELGVPEPASMAMTVLKSAAQKVTQEWCPKMAQFCNACCARICACCYKWTCCVITGGQSMKDEALFRKVPTGWRVPKTCNGMCKGAKFARRNWRKLQRIEKRKGKKNEKPWYSKPYKCTCVVK